jgi:iron complex outermembrane recepter protein
MTRLWRVVGTWSSCAWLALAGVPAHAQEQGAPPAQAPAPVPAPDPGLSPDPDPSPSPSPSPDPDPSPSPSPDPDPSPNPSPSPSPDPERDRGPVSGPDPAALPVPGAREPLPIQPPLDADAGYGAVALTPSPGAGVRIEKVPRNVQHIDRATLEREHSVGLADALNARLGGVVINDVQNNPLQPDFQYRGFTASPLLGTPQGIAVHQNGVRLNEPFGDVLQWDLVPEFAISEVQLYPGPSPTYGHNALGGSLSLRMKNGFRDPGHRVEALAGSFGRHQVSAEYGDSFGDVAVYAGVAELGEAGFRDHSRSRARHLHADLRHSSTDQEVGVSVTLADTALNGNGPAPVELLARDRDAVFTYPDTTRNELLLAVADLDRQLTARASVQATAYLRRLQRDTLNGDEGEFELCADPDSAAELLCDEEGELLRSETGASIAAGDPFDGLFNTTRTQTDGYGGRLQLSLTEPLLRRPNRLFAGVSYDGAQVDFLQRAELGRLTAERTVLGERVFLAGAEFRTDLRADNRNLGVYASDTLSVLDPLAIQIAARFDWMNVEIDDRDGTALEGDHVFHRVNPAIGATVTPIPELTLFASYSESSRAPSASELACADPDEPCRVPNAFVADPPLDQVVNRGVELGARGVLGDRKRPLLSWSLAGFGSRNADDILFVAGSRAGTGYFRNAGETQRVGVEVAAEGNAGPLRWHAGYALLRATFESELELPGGAHPRAVSVGDDEEDAVIAVEPGDRIPGLPVHSAKLGVDVRPLPDLELGVSAIAHSARPLRGDEANLLAEVDGYVILGARASYQLLEPLQLFIKAENLLDAEYDTFGIVADPSEVLADTSDPRFLGPGAPIGLWIGIAVQGS